MRSMSAPSDGVPVWHYDGRTAIRHQVWLLDEGDAFRLTANGVRTGPFAWRDLVAHDASTGTLSYGLASVPGWRIGFPDGPGPVAARLPPPRRYGRLVDRFGLWPAVGAFACLAALTVAGVLRTPPLVARLVPQSVERALGEAMVGDFGRRGCATPAGTAALDALMKRINPDDPELEVHVVNIDMVNAVTLPGGRIVVFNGLLKQAANPDEVAGVLGHELGHVRHRDTVEALVRQLGLSVLLGGFEGHVGGYTNALLATAYSRRAEAKADGFSIDTLRDARISPVPTAGFFRRLGRHGADAERMFAYVASHPVSAERAAAFERSGRKGAAYSPALDPAQWAALKDICRGTSAKLHWRF